MTTAYPLETADYFAGKCPALEYCVSSMQDCESVNCVGDDNAKCKSAACRSCQANADNCAAKAKNCGRSGSLFWCFGLGSTLIPAITAGLTALLRMI